MKKFVIQELKEGKVIKNTSMLEFLNKADNKGITVKKLMNEYNEKNINIKFKYIDIEKEA